MIEENTITERILHLCYQIEFKLNSLHSVEELLAEIKKLVEQRDNLRKVFKGELNV